MITGNNNIGLSEQVKSVNTPSLRDPDVNSHGDNIKDKSINVEVAKPLFKRKINFKNITIGLPYKITCKPRLNILSPNKNFLYPHTYIANEFYYLLTDIQMRFFFKNKEHLVCKFLEENLQHLKIMPPNVMRPFHTININGNNFNLIPKSKLSFHIKKVTNQNIEQAEPIKVPKELSEYEIEQEKSRMRIKLWSLNLMPEILDSILACFLKDPKLEDLELPDCSLTEIAKIKELVKS